MRGRSEKVGTKSFFFTRFSDNTPKIPKKNGNSWPKNGSDFPISEKFSEFIRLSITCVYVFKRLKGSKLLSEIISEIIVKLIKLSALDFFYGSDMAPMTGISSFLTLNSQKNKFTHKIVKIENSTIGGSPVYVSTGTFYFGKITKISDVETGSTCSHLPFSWKLFPIFPQLSCNVKATLRAEKIILTKKYSAPNGKENSPLTRHVDPTISSTNKKFKVHVYEVNDRIYYTLSDQKEKILQHVDEYPYNQPAFNFKLK